MIRVCEKCGGPLNIDCTAPYCTVCNGVGTIKLTPLLDKVVINGTMYSFYDIISIQAELSDLHGQIERGEMVRVPCKVGDTICLDAVGPFGVDMLNMPYHVKGVSLDLYGDWGGVTQERTISLDEARAALQP